MLVQEMIKDFYGIQSELSRIFSQPPTGTLAAFPAVVVSSRKDDLTLEAKLPGVDPEKINISVKNKELRISGEIPKIGFTEKGDPAENSETNKVQTHRLERWSGKFERVLTLPKSVTGDNVEASYENGILKLILPIREEEKARQISVKVK